MAGSSGVNQLWSPLPAQVRDAHMTDYMRWVSKRQRRSLKGYSELWRWSVDEIEQFWESIWEYCGVRASAPYEQVLSSREMPGARWFAGARLNYAENLLMRDPRADLPGSSEHVEQTAAAALGSPGAEGIAVIAHSELREPQELSWAELREQVAEIAEGLRTLGVGPGDRVAAYMPNIPETLVAFLACASIGAIFSSAAPEFGARSVIDRFAQIEPKALLAVDGYRHGGRDFDRSEQLLTIARELPSLERTVLLPYLDGRPLEDRLGEPSPLPAVGQSAWEERGDANLCSLPGVLEWSELQALGRGAQLRFEQVEFDHPLWVLYSSGTTGLPKAIVHGHGGILLEQLKKSALHLDLHQGERVLWFTTTGWMMWNFLIGGLFTGAAIVLYDGSPAHPDMGALWRLAERARITCMGLSAGYLSACEKAEIEPGREYDLSALRSIGSTGSPLPPEGFRWVYEHVKRDVWLFSTSGGTDVCTAFLGGCPLLPVYEGELQCRALGCAVQAWDEQGRELIDEVGELVLTEPLPSMPLYLWGDADGERYRDSYFSMYPGIWRHGDWVRITPRGGAVIYGRSDSTINRQGVRIGTSEIYRATSAVDEVLDALVVDVPDLDRDGELSMILFVVLSKGVTLGEDLTERIRRRIREDCSPRHVPNQVMQIEEVPRTLSGKALEVPVKRILMGTPVQQAASRESLANPASLEYFVRLADERWHRRARASSTSKPHGSTQSGEHVRRRGV
jgi:acetoacetyl-CoA synthetase